VVYLIIVYELHILFWLVFSFKKLSLYYREIRDIRRHFNRSKLRLYRKEDR
jgi:hypothetical protein